MAIPSKQSVETLILEFLQTKPGEWLDLSPLLANASRDDLNTSANKLRGQGDIDSKLHTIDGTQKTLYRRK